MRRAKTIKAFLHYGDDTHRPMQTVKFDGTARELKALVDEAKMDNWPLHVQRESPPLRTRHRYGGR